MIYLRPQKTYRAPAISDGRNENELFPPTDQSRYRVIAEALRGRVISNDNPKLCFTALIFDARDGSNLTERLRENGFRPGWFLDGKAVDASLITDGGYTLTIEKEQLTNAFVRLTLRTRDTDILLALVHPDYRPIYERVIAQGAISSVVIEQSEDLVNQLILDELSKSALTEIKRYFTLEISKKADKSELITPEQIKELAHALDEERKVGGRNLITAESCANRTSDDEYRWLLEAGEYTYIKLCNQRDFPTLKAGEEVTLSILIQCDKSDWNGYEWAIRISDVQGTVKYLEPNNVTQDGFCLHKWTFTIREEGRTPMIELYNHIFRRDDAGNIKYNKRIEAKQIKLERGNVATDWTPAPEDFEGAITDLKKNTLTEIEKEWVGKMGSILFPNMEDSPQNKGGLSIDRSMFLRFSDGKPSALIGGQIGDRSGGNAILMAGVNGYGTDNLSARTAIYQDGTARFGDVNLSDKTISLMPKSGLPLRVTAEDGTFIENFLANSKVDKNIAYEHSFVLVGKGEARTYSFDVANNDTKLTITIPTLTSEVYQINQSVTLTLDGVTLGSWRGDTKLIREDTSGFEGGGVRFRKENTPLVVENLKFERYLNSGSHTLSVSVTSTDTKDKATISKLTAHLYYDASQAETNLTRYGFRAFGGQSRYFDIDWRWTYRYKGYMTTSNPYIARVKGGMRVDSLTLEQPLDAPGCVLAGGEVDSNGQVTKSFGRYKKKQGDNTPSTKFDYNTHYYTVYHSINNTNYIPIVTSRSSAWADVPRVMSVSSNSFTIAFINETNKVSDWRQPFIYTCYKAD